MELGLHMIAHTFGTVSAEPSTRLNVTSQFSYFSYFSCTVHLMGPKVDVVVVGARCAGSPLAAMLAARGMRVCVIDRARFPSETPSTHVIQPCGVQILDQLDLMKPLLAAGAVPLDRFTMVSDDVRMEASVSEVSQHPVLCVRRVTLDALLVQAAAAAGAQVRTGSRVTGLLTDDDGRVTGVHTDRGSIGARVVVGADGRHSAIASAVGAQEYHVCPPGRLAAWAYFEGVTDRNGHIRFGRVQDLGFLAGPTDSDLYMAAIAPNLMQQADFDADRNGYFTAALRQWPELAEIVAGGTQVGPIRAVSKWHGYFRQSAGPGWVLVGDAGHFKDFTPGQGIADALRQAKHLADAIEKGCGATDLDTALQSWWSWRDKDAYEMYWFASLMGRPGAASPLTNRLMRDISLDPEATRSFVRILNHDVRPSRLFTPALLARATARTVRDEPGRIVATLKEAFASGKRNARQAWQTRIRPPGMTNTAW